MPGRRTIVDLLEGEVGAVEGPPFRWISGKRISLTFLPLSLSLSFSREKIYF